MNTVEESFYASLLLFPEFCGRPDVAEDSFCDDENNNAGCNWDGGYCCGDQVLTNYCTQCECLDPEFQGIYFSTFSRHFIY